MSETRQEAYSSERTFAEWLADEGSATHFSYFRLLERRRFERRSLISKSVLFVIASVSGVSFVAWSAVVAAFLEKADKFSPDIKLELTAIVIFVLWVGSAAAVQTLQALKPRVLSGVDFHVRGTDAEFSSQILLEVKRQDNEITETYNIISFPFVIFVFCAQGFLSWWLFHLLAAKGAAPIFFLSNGLGFWFVFAFFWIGIYFYIYYMGYFLSVRSFLKSVLKNICAHILRIGRRE